MNKKIVVTVLAGTLLAFTQLASACPNTRLVEDKRILTVPGTNVPCYFMEVEETSSGGEEVGEEVNCYSKEQYDRNRVGAEFVDKDGNILK